MRLRLLSILVTCLLASGLASHHDASLQIPPISPPTQPLPEIGTVTIAVTSGQPANTFVPTRAFGAGVDGLEKGNIAQVYTSSNIRAMLSAGFHPLTYRLRTELGIEAWHWNPKGRWSDPKRKQGYWTSSQTARQPISICNGYRLPRRGSTIDQANNDSYSRLDDDDTRTFWKSNPYLDRHFTGDDNALHPQWIIIDLGVRKDVDGIKILWGTPYATRYQIEYWQGVDPIYINENPEGNWQPFYGGVIRHGTGGNTLLKLCDLPIEARFFRIMMTAGSHTAPPGSHDIRDRLGYAIREIYLGTIENSGQLQDILKHGKRASHQTVMYASSTDPWHQVSDKDQNIEQPGFDLVFKSGLTCGLPVLVPVAPLYDTPDNAAAEIRFLKLRGYRIERIEMGEEPDGQYVTPEDYGALYIQWAQAIHRVDPHLQLGGPGFQTSIVDYKAWPDRSGNQSWMNRFLNYLRSRNHSSDFTFFTFEWYPFDDVCASTAPQLVGAPELLSGILNKLEQSGLSRSIPWMITEYGFSSFAGQAEVDMPGALLNADIVAQFLTLGGSTAYFYGYEPNSLITEVSACNTWGNLALFLADDERQIKQPLATYYGARLLTRQWAQPGDRPHSVYPAISDIKNAQGQAIVTSYAVHRPDRQWAILLINKDPMRSWPVKIRFHTKTGPETTLQGPLDLYQYSSAQYVWHPQKEHGYAKPDLPPQHSQLPKSSDPVITLPPYSLSVVRGQGPPVY
jgi:hypothetical protein